MVYITSQTKHKINEKVIGILSQGFIMHYKVITLYRKIICISCFLLSPLQSEVLNIVLQAKNLLQSHFLFLYMKIIE